MGLKHLNNTYQVDVRISEEDWGLLASHTLNFKDLMVLVDQYNYGLPNEAYLSINLDGTQIPVEAFYMYLPEPA